MTWRRQADRQLTLKESLKWNLNQNTSIFIQENTFEIVACKLMTILSRPQYFNVIVT